MKINPKIFKAYDIRGIYPDDLNEEIAYLIGRAYVKFLKKKKKPKKDKLIKDKPAIKKDAPAPEVANETPAVAAKEEIKEKVELKPSEKKEESTKDVG